MEHKQCEGLLKFVVHFILTNSNWLLIIYLNFILYLIHKNIPTSYPVDKMQNFPLQNGIDY